MTKIHLITGGSSGIGRECAKRFKEGLVVLSSRGEEKLMEAVEELRSMGIEAIYRLGDVSDPISLNRIFDELSTMGSIQTIIHSAGVSGVGESPEKTLTIDLLGSAHLLQGALRVAQNDTVVIMISSMMGHVVTPHPELDALLSDPLAEGAFQKLLTAAEGASDKAYNLSKRGVHLLVQRYTNAFGEKGARVLSVSPGIIMTTMAKAAAEIHPEPMNLMKRFTPCGRNGEPEDVADAVQFLASPNARFITGTDLRVDGGLTLNLAKIAAMMATKRE